MPEISVDNPERNRRVFDNILWQRIGQKYRQISRNSNETDFIFDFEDIRRNVNDERGLGIEGFYEPFIEQRLQEIENRQGLVQIIRDRRQFRLTRDGIQYCKRLPITFG